MFRRPQYIALGAVVLLVVIVLTLPRQASAHLKLAISSLFLPLFGLASSSHQLGQKVADNFAPRLSLLKQLEALRRENQQLRLQAVQIEAALQENTRLRQQLGFQRQSPWKEKLRLTRV